MINNTEFSQKIIIWYQNFKIKSLPWQLNKTIYHVWLSEIMLQQTQVNTVIPYYKKFIKKFPTIEKLAIADLNEILHLWSGLGYYTRAKNLYKTAKIIVEDYNSIFPEDFNTLISLPGIGRSTAGAVLSLALNKRYPILDSNIKRILIRYHAIDYYATITHPKKNNNRMLWILSTQLMPTTRISTFNQAMMTLGQLICTNKNPKCNCCPIQNKCQSFLTHTTQQYPKKITKKKLIKKIMWLLLLIQCHNQKIWLEQRLNLGIWKELFCFPEFNTLNALRNWLLTHNFKENQCKAITIVKCKLSNIDLKIKPIILYVDEKFSYNKKNGIWCNFFNLPAIGIPKPILTILQQLKQHSNKM